MPPRSERTKKFDAAKLERLTNGMDAKTLQADLALTRKNRETLFHRPNRLFWYQKSFLQKHIQKVE
jgi:hypothetical protein